MDDAEIFEFWKKNNVIENVRSKNKGKKPFYFLDGPPYATGSIHMGTAWNKILKDCYIRFRRMKGFDVWDKAGYDTHGIPIENKVEKELKLGSKKDIEKVGVDNFIIKCREFATKHIEIMNEQFFKIGVWMDFENPYLTLDNSYIEGGWYVFKAAYDKGLLEPDLYPVHVCTHCETAVAYNEIEYKKIDDKAIFVKFPTKNNEYLLIWTTTPWTLPSNTGIMANPDAEYIKIETEKGKLIFAKELMENVEKKCKIKLPKNFETIKGKDLEGLEYENPMAHSNPQQDNLKNAHRVVMSKEIVKLDEGSGLVHTAPGHGEEDFKIGKKLGLPVINPLGLDGIFKQGKYEGRKARDCNKDIIKYLIDNDYIAGVHDINHDYPICWRCNTHLLLMVVPQWFFRIEKIHKKLLEENEKINWNPNWAKKRFKDWLENIGDWPISRQRYWGIPLPIWICEKCDEKKVIGSSDELPEKLDDFHRPYIDKIIFECKCKGKMKRIPDVLDVWFDSGLASWASLGYPKKKDDFDKLWPADFQTEGPDQIRGWWNSQMITSVITFDKSPFKNILYHGFVLDSHGIKMSKSKGNFVDPFDIIEKNEIDVLRYYLLSTSPWDDFYFNWEKIKDISKIFKIIENTFNFVKLYSKEKKEVKLNPEDEWILSKLNSCIKKSTKELENYNAHKACQEITNFIINDFSRVYIKLIRNRTWPTYTGEDRYAAFNTLNEIAEKSCIALSPICPFITEKLWLETLNHKDSIHMEEYPETNEKMISEEIEKSFDTAQKLIETVGKMRQEAKIKLRWPLKTLVIGDLEIKENTYESLKKMCNVKEIIKDSKNKENFLKYEMDDTEIFLDIEMTEDLRKEAMIREVIRKIQQMRKENKMIIEDEIKIKISKDVKEFEKLLEKEVGAKEIINEEGNEELEFNNEIIKISIEKI